MLLSLVSLISERSLNAWHNPASVRRLCHPPYEDGFTRVVLSPIESMGRREALVPRLRVYLTRFQGVLSPRSKLRDYFVSQKPVDENENRESTLFDERSWLS